MNSPNLKLTNLSKNVKTGKYPKGKSHFSNEKPILLKWFGFKFLFLFLSPELQPDGSHVEYPKDGNAISITEVTLSTFLNRQYNV